MKTMLKTNVLRILTFILVISAVLMVATLPSFAKANEPDPMFQVNQVASVRVADGEDAPIGLRFSTTVNNSWKNKNANNGDVQFGTLIFDIANGSLDATKSVDENKAALSAIDVRGDVNAFNFNDAGEYKYYAAITSDMPEFAEMTAYEFAAIEFAAVSYALVDNNVIYTTNLYSTSMRKTANILALDDANADIVAKLEKYFEKQEVSFDKGVYLESEGLFGYKPEFAEAEIVVGKTTIPSQFVNGKIVFASNVYDIANVNLALGENNIVNVFYNNGKVVRLSLLAVTDVIETAQDFKTAFESGSATHVREGYYVLGNNIDANGVKVTHKGTTDWTEGAFVGTFDGCGYTVSNLTVDNYGIFGNVNGAVIKNVAFDNVKPSNAPAAGKNQGPVLAASARGTATDKTYIENVYASVSADFEVTKGFIYYSQQFTVLNNVVVDHSATTRVWNHDADKDIQYGLGSFIGDERSILQKAENQANINNVYVISQLPLGYYKMNNYTNATGGHYTYASNETQLWADPVADDELNTVADYAAIYKTASNVEVAPYVGVSVLNGVKRYDDATSMVAANNDYASFSASGLWTVVDGMPVWNTLSELVYVNDVAVKGAITLNKNDTATITAKIAGTAVEEITVASENDAVVSVAENVITATGFGSTRIIVTYGEGKSISIPVTVSIPEISWFADGTAFTSDISVLKGDNATITFAAEGVEPSDVTLAVLDGAASVSAEGNVLTAVDYGTATVQATITLDSYTVTKVFNVTVDLPLITWSANGEQLLGENVSITVVNGETATITSTQGGEDATVTLVVVEGVSVSVEGNVITAIDYGTSVVKASITVDTTVVEKLISVEVPLPEIVWYANDAVVTDSIVIATGETATVTATAGGEAADVTLTVANGLFVTVNGNVITGAGQGADVVTAAITVGSVTVTVNFNVNVLGKAVEVVSTAIDYDASTGEFNAEILEDKEVSRVYYLNGQEEIALADLVLEAKVGSSNVITVLAETADKIYSFTNVSYWTSIISDATELLIALDFQGTRDFDNSIIYFNAGYYKLDSDIDMAGQSFDHLMSYVKKDGNTIVDIVAAEKAPAGYTASWDLDADDATGFAGYFDGFGHVIDNFNAIDTNLTYDMGLFAKLYSNGTEDGCYSATVKNFALTNVVSSASVLALNTSNVGKVTIDNVYVQMAKYEAWNANFNNGVGRVEARKTYTGLITNPNVSLSMNAVVVDNTVHDWVDASDVDGDGNTTEQLGGWYANTTSGGSLFSESRALFNATSDSMIKNVYVLTEGSISYKGFGAAEYKAAYAVGNNEIGYTFTDSPRYFLSGNKDVYAYGAYAANETEGNVPFINGFKGDTLTLADATDAQFKDSNNYTWACDDLSGVAAGSATANGSFKFSGIKKYSNATAMASDTNNLSAFNSYWKIVSGVPVWGNLVNDIQSSITVDGKVVESGFEVGNGNTAELKVYVYGNEVEFTAVASNANVTVDGNKVTGAVIGDSVITLTITLANGVTAEKVLAVTVTKPVTEITDAIDYDATVGEFISDVYADEEVEAIYYVNGEEKSLLEDLVLEAKVGTSNVILVQVETADKIYNFTNVSYWTSIISNANEFKAALDFQGTRDANNQISWLYTGFYKLDSDIDMDGVILDHFMSFTKTTDGVTEVVAAAKAPSGYSTVWDTDADDNTGFAGYFDGFGHVIDNFNACDGNATYDMGLFGKLYSDGTNEGNYSATIKNFALTNVISSGSVLALNTSIKGKVTIENVYVQMAEYLAYNHNTSKYEARKTYTGLITNPGVSLSMNAVVVDNTVHNWVDSSDVDGDGNTTEQLGGYYANMTSGGSLFSESRPLFNANSDSNIQNVYVLTEGALTYKGYGSSEWKAAYAVGDAENGYTFTTNARQYNTGKKDVYAYAGYAANETEGNVPFINGFKGDTLTLPGATAFTTATNYTWACDDLSGVAAGSATANGSFKFSGIKKYASIDDMAVAGNDLTSFDNANWTVIGGVPLWHSLTSDVSATIMVDGNAVESGFEIGNGSSATISAIALGSEAEISIVASNNNVEVNENVVTAKAIGTSELTITVTLAEGLTKNMVITVTVTKPVTEIADAIDYDATVGEFNAEILEGEDVEAIYYVNGEEKSLLSDLVLEAKVGTSNVILVQVETADKIYSFTNVSYWTSIISDAAELKAVLDFEGTSDASGITWFVSGFYKMDSDIDLENVPFKHWATLSRTVDGVKEFVVSEGMSVKNYNATYTAEGTADDYKFEFDTDANDKTGFAGYFDGQGHVISNFDAQDYNPTYKLGLFGKFFSDGTVDGKYSPVVKNFAITNVTAAGGVLGRATSTTGKVTFENIFVEVTGYYKHRENNFQYRIANGLIDEANASINMNNVVVDAQAYDWKDSADLDGDGDLDEVVGGQSHAVSSAGALFGNAKGLLTAAGDSQITNVYVLSKASIAYNALGTASWKASYAVGDAETGYTFKEGAARDKVIVAYAANETIGNVPVIKGFKGDTLTLAGATDAQFKDSNNYTWGYDDLSSLESGVLTNGMFKFSGVKKYDSIDDMAVAGNDLSSFANANWTVIGGAPIWHTLTNDVSATIMVDGSAVESGFEIGNGSSATISAIALGTEAEISIVASNNNVEVNENVVTAKALGETTLTITVTLADGLTKDMVITVTVTKPVTEITDAIDYDATVGEFNAEILEGEDVEAIYYVNGEEKSLLEDLVLEAKVGTSNVILVQVVTADKIYNFTNVSYWTSIISNANEFKAALDFQGTRDANNQISWLYTGFYKLDSDIDMDGVILDHFMSFTKTTDGVTEVVAAAKAPSGYSTVWDTDADDNTGFAGYFDGQGHVIDNFNACDGNATYDMGLFGKLYSNGTAEGNYSATIKNFALTNVVSSAAVLALNTSNKGKVTIENVYVQMAEYLAYNHNTGKYEARKTYTGLITNPNVSLSMNAVVVDNTVHDFVDSSDVDGDGNVTEQLGGYYANMTTGGSLFAESRPLFNATNDSNIQNVYVLTEGTLSYNGFGASDWKSSYAVATETGYEFTSTPRVGKNSAGTKTLYAYGAYAANETEGNVPFITGFKGDTLTLPGATAFTTATNYTWACDDLSGVAAGSATANGSFKFSGIKKYASAEAMAADKNNNTLTAFNSNWTIINGVPVWRSLAGNIEPTVKINGVAATETQLALKGSVAITADIFGEAQEIVLATEDTSIVSIEENVVSAIGAGTATITATVGEKVYTITITVPTPEISYNVADEFNVDLLSTQAVTYQISNGEVMDDVTLAVVSGESVTVDGNVITAVKFGSSEVKISFELFGTTIEKTVVVNVPVPNVVYSVEDVEEIIFGNTLTVTYQVADGEVMNDAVLSVVEGESVSVNGNVISTVAYGETQVKIAFTYNSQLVEKTITVNVVKPVIDNDSAVEYDAAADTLYAEILNDKTVETIKLVNGEETVLASEANIEATVGATNEVTLLVETNDTIYRFTNVTYWASIISNADEFRAAFDFQGTRDANNQISWLYTGFYKLDSDIDMDGVILDHFMSFTKTTDGVTEVVAAAKAPSGYSTVWDTDADDKTGFAGYFDGQGHVIDNFNACDGNATYDMGLFGKLYSDGTNEGNYSATIKNFALTNVVSSAAVLAMNTSNKGKVTIENVYVQMAEYLAYNHNTSKYEARKTYTGLISNPDISLSMNAVVVDNTVHDWVDASDVDGDGNVTEQLGGYYANMTTGGSLFSESRPLFNANNDSMITNVYVLTEGSISYKGYGASEWKAAYAVGDAENGYTFTTNARQYNNGKKDIYAYAGYAANETEGNVPFINGFNGDTLTLPGATAFTATTNYTWACDDLSDVAAGTATANGSFKFSGIKKYASIDDMAVAGNDLTSFNSYWTVIGGVPVWHSLTSDVSATIMVDGNAVESGFEIGNGSSATISAIALGSEAEISIVANNNNVEVNGNVVTAKAVGTSELTITITLAEGLTKDMVITVTVTKPVTEITDAIDYDATTKQLLTNAFDGEDVEAIYYVNGEEKSLLSDLVLEAKVGTSNVITVQVQTADNIYNFTNVTYWTSIISDADEFRAAFDFEGTRDASGITWFVSGFYKMDSDIDLENVPLKHYATYSRTVEGVTEYVVANEGKAISGYSMAWDYDAHVKSGFAGYFDGQGHVIDNFDAQDYNSVYKLGLFGKFYSDGTVEGKYSPVVKNFAVTNVTAAGGVLGKATSTTGKVTFENIFVEVTGYYQHRTNKFQYRIANGLIDEANASLNMNNVVVDAQAYDWNDSADLDGDGDLNEVVGGQYHAVTNAGALFGNVKGLLTATADSQITNVYVLSKSSIAYNALGSGSWKASYAVGDAETGYTFKEGAARDKVVVTYAANETVSNVPVITGFKGDTLTLASATDKDFQNAANYTWGYDDLTGLETGVLTNGMFKFSGVKKYDNVNAMASASNDLTSFNSYWTVIGGVPVWHSLTSDVSATIMVDGNAVESGFEIGNGSSATISAIALGSEVEISIAASNNNVEVNENVVTAKAVGATELTITVTLADGLTVEAVITVTVTKPVTEITDAIDYDATTKQLLTNAYDGEVVDAVYYVNGEEKSLLEDLVLEAKVGTSNVINVQVETADKIYNFTNVSYWTSIISDANEFKSALDFQGTRDANNQISWLYAGFYKLDSDIDMDGVILDHFMSFYKTTDGVTDVVAAAKAPSGYSTHWDTDADDKTGFAGYFDGFGHVIDNFNACDGNATYDMGLFGKLYSDGTNEGNYSATIKNFALTNVVSSAAVLALNTSNKGKVTIDNVYVQMAEYLAYNHNTGLYNARKTYTGLISSPNVSLSMNAVVVDNTVHDWVDSSDVDGDGNVTEQLGGYYANMTTGGTLFSESRPLFNATNDSMITNVYVLTEGTLSYNGFGASDWKSSYAVATETGYEFTSTPRVGKNSAGTKTLYAYAAYAANETAGNVPFINGFNGDTLTLPGATAFTTATNYTWACDDLSGVAAGSATANGSFKFSGVKKYASAEAMAADKNNNTLTAFNSNWTIINGVPVWHTLTSDVSATLMVGGNAVESGFELGNGSSATITAIALGAESEISIVADNTNVEVNENVVTAKAIGTSELTITITLAQDLTITKTLTVTVTKAVTEIDDAIDFDASANELLTNVLDGQEIHNVYYVNGEEKTALEDLALKATVGTSNKINVQVETNAGIYNFTNVTYWTVIISNNEEFRQVFDFEETRTGKSDDTITWFVDGFYKLDSDVDLEGVALKHWGTLTRTVGGVAEYVSSEGMTVKDYNNAKTEAGNTDDYSFVFDTDANDRTGFAGYFDGFGYVIDNFFARDENPTYKLGLFGKLYSDGTATGNYSATVKNFALNNVSLTYSSLSILALNSSTTGAVTIDNVYVKISGNAYMPNGLIGTPGKNVNMNAVIVNYPNYRGYTDAKDYDQDGDTTEVFGAGFWNQGTGGLVFGNANNVFNATSDANIKNVYTISVGAISYVGPSSSAWKSTFATGDSTNGYTFAGTARNKNYAGYAANATVGNVPFVVDLTDTLKAPTAADNNTGFRNIDYYVLACDDISSLEAGVLTNGMFRFSGVKSYLNAGAMTNDAQNNNFNAFSSDYWTVVDGIPTWNRLTAQA